VFYNRWILFIKNLFWNTRLDSLGASNCRSQAPLILMSASDGSSSKSSKPWDTGGRRCRVFHRIGKPDSQTIARDVYFRVMVQVSRSADQKVRRFAIFWWPLICQLYSFDDSEPIWPAIVIPLTRNPSPRCLSICWCRWFSLLLICWSVILLLSLIFVRSLFFQLYSFDDSGPIWPAIVIPLTRDLLPRRLSMRRCHWFALLFICWSVFSFFQWLAGVSFLFWRQARVSVFSFYRPLK